MLVAVVTVLTILLTVIGVQVVYILKEVREMLRKFNGMVDDGAKLTKSLTTSVGSLAGFGAGLKAAVKLVELLKGRKKEKEA